MRRRNPTIHAVLRARRCVFALHTTSVGAGDMPKTMKTAIYVRCVLLETTAPLLARPYLVFLRVRFLRPCRSRTHSRGTPGPESESRCVPAVPLVSLPAFVPFLPG